MMSGPSYQASLPEVSPPARPPLLQSRASDLVVSSEADGLQKDRLRYLKACDRCRSRKIKCDHDYPCGRCVAASASCTFGASSSAAASDPSDKAESSTSAQRRNSNSQPQARKRRRTRSSLEPPAVLKDDQEDAPVRILDHGETAHFFLTQDGIARFCGSTSGLPLLDATRRLAAARAKIPEASQIQNTAEPDWTWLSSMLGEGRNPETISMSPLAGTSEFYSHEDEELFFPGKAMLRDGSETLDIYSTLTAVIAPDLLASLIQVYFSHVHPSWPILHIQSFFLELYRWSDYSFAALVVAMCMLASRHVQDPRVRSDPSDAASAGVHYHPLFRKFRDYAETRDHVIYAIQSHFLAAKFHCVDNIPHPIAQGLFATAVARCFDGGLHRMVPASLPLDPIEREIRVRTFWAVYCWDKQLSAVCGRPPIVRIGDTDTPIPAPFTIRDATDPLPPDHDPAYVEVFVQLINVSAVLEQALAACNHRPDFDNAPFLNQFCKDTIHPGSDSKLLDAVDSCLERWREQLPPSLAGRQLSARLVSPLYSLASEQVAAIEETILLTTSSRRMQLATASLSLPDSKSPPKAMLGWHRDAVVAAARRLVASVVQLGSEKLLQHCDIMFVYRVLMAGRLLIACLLSARADHATQQEETILQAVRASSMLLHHMVAVIPIALGSSEVLDETCRVCNIPLPGSLAGVRGSQRQRKYAWYRPLGYSRRDPDMAAQGQHAHEQPSPFASTLVPLIGAGHVGIPTPPTAPCQGDHHLSTPSAAAPADTPDGDFDLTWLFPGQQAYHSPAM